MQSIVSKKSFICFNCMNRLKILKAFESTITTKPPKNENKVSVKTKSKLQLNVRKFPRLLKDLEKLDKRLSSDRRAVIETRFESETKDFDIISHNVKNVSKKDFIEELDESKISSDWIESVPNHCFHNYNVLSPEIEEIKQLIEIPKDNECDKTGGKAKEKQTKLFIRHEEIRKQLKEVDIKAKTSSLRSSLKSYIHSCIYADLVSKAHSVLLYYRNRSLKSIKNKTLSEDNNPIDVSVYNTLMKGWAQKGKTVRIKELFNLMKATNIKPNTESFVYYFLSISRQLKEPTNEEIVSALNQMKDNCFDAKQMFDKSFLSIEEKNCILNFLNQSFPDLRINEINFPNKYSSNLMKPIVKSEQKPFNPSEGVSLEGLEAAAKQQFSLEINGNITIKSIVSDEMLAINENTKKFLQNQWKKTENEWKNCLKESFSRRIRTLQTQSNEINGMTLYPYLIVLDTQYYIDAMIEEIRLRANMSEYYSPPMSVLYSSLGRRIMLRYLVKTHIRDGTAQDFQHIYDKYLEYYKNPNLTTKYNPRQFWHKLMAEQQHYYNDNSRDKAWPYHVQIAVGQFLYDIMVQEIKIDSNIMRANTSAKKRSVLAFGIAYKSIGNLKYQKEFRAHPTLTRLFRKACMDSIMFDINMLPMLCPPSPWISPKFGGYLLTKTDFVRMPDNYRKWVYSNYDNQSLYPSFDSLNYLSMCPWILNEKVLDVAIHVFKNKGDSKLSIPRPSNDFPPLPTVAQSMSKSDKIQAFRQRNQQKREMAEMYSLWCDSLYKLSIANHLRKKVFWFPNNMDFRGRVYPVPPHFNHLGCDLTRSLILFAKGQPLGERGLDWLKIHLINLTGLKKRCSLEERLAFANEMLFLIMDSADNPLGGQKWWTESDDPWQTLACAIEITNAVRSKDHTKYVCHFPVHQDGSCNGLQHYAALGRDQAGAESVNLYPAERPKDVYSDVAALVEQQRAKDANEGHEIAKLLDGFVERKIVKQTVMTYVYGVTRFGAKLQIFKRLKETETFPKEKAFSAAIYLTHKTFLSIQQMFTETRAIQEWLTECATIISKLYEKPVDWVTPLGFPVVQHYHKPKAKVGETFLGIGNETNLRYLTRFDFFQKPNTLKQKNAFPPNFIHSLDSTHMMLTSLHCHKEGLSFASVHDCFWTHPNCVEIMNSICRQQFVSLHNEPILDDLSKHFLKTYGSLVPNANKSDIKNSLEVLGKQLKKGSFRLQNVLNSTYFFS